MPTRNVVLTDQQESMIERLVAGGLYQNASEVLREGLRLIEQREREEQTRLEALREAIREGVADIEAGRYETFATTDSLAAGLARLTEAALADDGR